MRRPYKTESAISPGCGVVQGSSETLVKAPGSGGSGDFIGVYPFEANAAKEAGDQLGIEISEIAKVQAGGNVTAGKKAALKADTSGTFINVATTAGAHPTCGTFLQSGASGDYVDMIVERGSVTVPA